MNPIDSSDVPYGLVTLTVRVPEPGGETAVTSSEFTCLKLVAGVCPKLTPVVPSRYAPSISTTVPPPAGPVSGESAETSGGGGVTVRVNCWVAPGETPLPALRVIR